MADIKKQTNTPQDPKEYARMLPPGPEKKRWEAFLVELDRFSKMTPEESEAEAKRAGKNFNLAMDKLNLLNMSENERKAEVARRRAEARRASAEFEKELDELVAQSAAILTEEDFARRKDEAEVLKKITATDISGLAINFDIFYGKRDLGGIGAIFKKAAWQGKLGDFLNYYGYESNARGLNLMLDEMIIGDREILSDRAFDNFLYQQKVFSLAQDVSCLAAEQNQWSLAFSVGRKGRAWRQLGEEDRLAAVIWAIKKVKPQTAAAHFGPASYGYYIPREKGNPAAGREFVLGLEGRAILAFYGEFFEKKLSEKYFNPEAAEVLATVTEEFSNLGLPATFATALEKYLREIKNKPEMAEEILSEMKK